MKIKLYCSKNKIIYTTIVHKMTNLSSNLNTFLHIHNMHEFLHSRSSTSVAKINADMYMMYTHTYLYI